MPANSCRLVNGTLNLCLEPAGNLVAWDAAGNPVWDSSKLPSGNQAGYNGAGFKNCTTCSAVFQTDGNLVLYNTAFNGNAYHSYWASGTGGNNGAGYQLKIYPSYPFVAIVNSGGDLVYPAFQGAGGSVLLAGQCAAVGSSRFCMQSDGNLVMYTSSNAAPWFSGTSVYTSPQGGTGTSTYATFQTDGNLVLYNPAQATSLPNNAFWQTGSGGNPGSILKLLQTSPYVEITSPAGKVLYQ
jgi:hypothetical protein